MGLWPVFAFSQTASIQIKSEPEISVYLDGEFKGVTSEKYEGLILKNVPAGQRKLKFVNAKFASQEETITIQSGQVLLYKVKPFVPKISISQEGETDEGNINLKVGKILIQSLPTEITISIPDLEINFTKTQDKWRASDIPVGNYEFVFKMKSTVIRQKIAIPESKETKIMVDMYEGAITVDGMAINNSQPVPSSAPQEKIDYRAGKLTYNGFTYKTVVIGNQEWTVENFRTTKYNDGASISNITDDNTWKTTTTGAYCAYDNIESNVATYGYLYNWYAVNTGKLAPKTGGWRVPTDADWTKLTEFVGGKENAGTKLKAKSGWNENGGGTDEYGFSAFPGGSRNFYNGSFYNFGFSGHWWSSSEEGKTYAWKRHTAHNDTEVSRSNYDRRSGFSVRLVRDL